MLIQVAFRLLLVSLITIKGLGNAQFLTCGNPLPALCSGGVSLRRSLGVFGGKCTSLKMLLTVAEFIALQRTTPSPSLLLLLNPPFEVWLQVQDLPLLLELSLSRA